MNRISPLNRKNQEIREKVRQNKLKKPSPDRPGCIASLEPGYQSGLSIDAKQKRQALSVEVLDKLFQKHYDSLSSRSQLSVTTKQVAESAFQEVNTFFA